MRLLAITLIALLSATAAAAGPWPRAHGAIFLSTGTLWSRTPAGWRPGAEFLAEYGLRPDLVLALALRHGPVREGDLLARWHPPDLPGGWALGLSAGIRANMTGPDRLRLVAGADLGRGAETRAGSLWLRAGLRLIAARARPDIDLSAQLGLRANRWLGMLTLSHYRTPAGADTRLRPALGYTLSPRLTVVAEGSLRAGRSRDPRLSLTLWTTP